MLGVPWLRLSRGIRRPRRRRARSSPTRRTRAIAARRWASWVHSSLGREPVTTRAIVRSGVVIVLMTPVWTGEGRRRHDDSMRSGDDAEEVTTLDAIDREIVGELERDGRISWQDWDERPAVAEHDRRPGAATRAPGDHHRLPGRRRPGRPRSLARGAHQRPPRAELRRRPARGRLAAWPEVEEAVHVTGRFDFELKVSTSGHRGLDDLLVGMKRELGVAETETQLVLRRVVPGPGRQPLSAVPVERRRR